MWDQIEAHVSWLIYVVIGIVSGCVRLVMSRTKTIIQDLLVWLTAAPFVAYYAGHLSIEFFNFTLSQSHVVAGIASIAAVEIINGIIDVARDVLKNPIEYLKRRK